MNNRDTNVNRKRKNLTMLIMIIFILSISICIGLVIHDRYKPENLDDMTLEEMIKYTTKNNDQAIITIGTIENGTTTYEVYGNKGNKSTDNNYTYELGSLTEVFTTSLICKAIDEGKVSLDDSIDMYLNLPEKNYYPTIRRLITHTSGYESEYRKNSRDSNNPNSENSLQGITKGMIMSKLTSLDMKDMDYEFQHSDYAISVIGLILEEVYEQEYTSLMNNYISEELGLENTKISDDSGDLSNYWQWYAQDAYIPSAALLSNIHDMMRYLQIQLSQDLEYLHLAHSNLAEVNTSIQVTEKTSIDIDFVGAGWMIDKDKNITWHNSEIGNYNSYIGFDKESQLGVVVLSNLPSDYVFNATVMGTTLLDSLNKNNKANAYKDSEVVEAILNKTENTDDQKDTDETTENVDDQNDIEEAPKDISKIEIYDIVDGYIEVPYIPELEHHNYDWNSIVEKDGYKYYEDEKYQNSKIGIDVSKFQGDIDWQLVKESGVEFVIIRVGFRGYGTGELVVDEYFEKNIQGALDSGLEVGVYIFSQAIDEQEAIEEAEFVYNAIQGYDITYPVVFDTEEIKNDDARTDGLSPEQLTNITIAFCEKIKEYGYQPMIYANAKWFTTKLDLEQLEGYEKWYADYQEKPLYPYQFKMWQYSEESVVPGIDGYVDMNIYFN